jgi:sugar lactone lactonase YvrE
MGRATRVITNEIYFGECPRWREGRLWFSDFFAHAVKSVSPIGDLRTEFEMDDQPGGMGWMPDGSMLIVTMKKHEVLRRWPDGKVTVHAQLPKTGFRWNDMVVDGGVRAYVGSFGFDLHGEMLSRGVESVVADHPTAEVVCISQDGEVCTVAEGMHFPNRSVIAPDGRTLIVAETLGGVLTAFDIEADGALSGRRVWATIWPRVADGIALNAEGNIWVAHPLAPECFLVAPGGEVLEVIDTGQICYACMLGGDDGRTLWMLTAATSLEPERGLPPAGKLLAASVDVPHAGWP